MGAKLNDVLCVNDVYSLGDILYNIHVLDYPCLYIRIKGIVSELTLRHVSHKQILSVATLASSEWQYLYTTAEGLAVFIHYGDLGNILSTCNVEKLYGPECDSHLLDSYDFVRGAYWIVPKEFPLRQGVPHKLERLAISGVPSLDEMI